MFRKANLYEIRNHLKSHAVTMSDREFQSLTYKELKKISRMAAKAYGLYEQIDNIIREKEVSTPEIPMKKSS